MSPKSEQGQQQQRNPIASRPISPVVAVPPPPTKPMRPLTSYHIFFQLERELIIQTMAGEDADETILANKVYLSDVPARYRNIKLLPNWYAGPGKRQKRKHRKQHGQIGFLELSNLISTTWAQLEVIDPEVKRFVQKIAQDQIEEYYREMEEYKLLTDGVLPEQSQTNAQPVAPKKKNKKRKNDAKACTGLQKLLDQTILSPLPSSDSSSSFYLTPQMYEMDLGLEKDIEKILSSIECKALSLIPCISQESMPSLLGSEDHVVPKKRKSFHRKDSALSVSKFDDIMFINGLDDLPTFVSPMEEVDLLDNEILQLWVDNNY